MKRFYSYLLKFTQSSESALAHAYQVLVFKSPMITLVILLGIIAALLRFIPDFKLDASTDSLTLENDLDVAYYRESRQSFPSSDDFLVIAWRPQQPMFSNDNLQQLKQLKQQLLNIPNVKQVRSILDVPLLDVPNINLTEVSNHLTTLEDKGLPLSDNELASAQKALTQNALYKDLLINQQGDTCALQIIIGSSSSRDQNFEDAIQAREQLRKTQRIRPLSKAEHSQLKALDQDIKSLNQSILIEHRQTIEQVRSVMTIFKQNNTLFLGGIPMIVIDMLQYIDNDLQIFGIGVLIFLALTLAIIFRRLAWVITPLLCCTLTCLIMIGYLGWQKFPVTVISSNFISLLLIMTMSMIIHLIVQYRELALEYPNIPQTTLTQQTVAKMFKPCFYTVLTTIVAFGSLLVSEIKPVIDFGIMMTIGLCIAFAIAFLLFPALLCLLPKSILLPTSNPSSQNHHISAYFARFTEKFGNTILLLALLLTGICVWGISQLSVDNRFIDYFKSDTEIYQGMSLIDLHLGGTTPLDIIIDTQEPPKPLSLPPSDPGSQTDCFLDDDCLEDVVADDQILTLSRLDTLKKLHHFLETLPETGKVMSLQTTIALIEDIKDAPLDALELAFMDSLFPDALRGLLFTPFVNLETGQLRLTVRVRESGSDLQRQVLLDNIQHFMINELNLNPNQIHFTSMVVLYNNMLQSLFRSQIATIGVVFIGILTMFLVLFRSIELALIGLVPNLLAAAFVLGLMGILKMPLDMMTITIAAITIGIAVDDTIHYLYRFKTEFAKRKNYLLSMKHSHNSIGNAMYYTSITIIFGFSILSLSNFKPTIYFGLLTSLAMLIALISALTLLPQLIILFKPFGPETDTIEHKEIQHEPSF